MNKRVILILLPIMMVFILSGIIVSTVEHPGHCGATNPADIIFHCGSDAGSIECEYD